MIISKDFPIQLLDLLVARAESELKDKSAFGSSSDEVMDGLYEI